MTTIRLDLIRPSPHPVRSSWDEGKLTELAASMAEQGLIVPVKVRPADGLAYELVYGHRRVEAARRNGWADIDAIVEGVDDTAALIQALIENVQREDMTDHDEGAAYLALEGLGVGTGAAARMVGKAESWVKRCKALARDTAVSPFTDHPEIPNQANKAAAIRETLGEDIGARRAVAAKVVSEGLTDKQTRAVAEAVAAAPTPAIRQHLIDAPYSPYTHDAAAVRETPELYTDNIIRPADTDWRREPGVAEMLAWLRDTTRRVETFHGIAPIGKLAPENIPFLVDRVRKLAAVLTAWANELDAMTVRQEADNA